MSKSPILTHYVSPIDQFLNQYDQEHTSLSQSQRKEKAKYSRIYYLRDVADRPDKPKLPEWF